MATDYHKTFKVQSGLFHIKEHPLLYKFSHSPHFSFRTHILLHYTTTLSFLANKLPHKVATVSRETLPLIYSFKNGFEPSASVKHGCEWQARRKLCVFWWMESLWKWPISPHSQPSRSHPDGPSWKSGLNIVLFFL